MKILSVYSLTPCTILNFKPFYVCEGSAVISLIGDWRPETADPLHVDSSWIAGPPSARTPKEFTS